MKSATASTKEIAVLYVRCGGITRLISISLSAVFWLLVSMAGFFLYLHDPKVFSPLEKPYLALTALGLSPIALAVLTWRIFEKGCNLYLASYQEMHIDQ